MKRRKIKFESSVTPKEEKCESLIKIFNNFINIGEQINIVSRQLNLAQLKNNQEKFNTIIQTQLNKFVEGEDNINKKLQEIQSELDSLINSVTKKNLPKENTNDKKIKDLESIKEAVSESQKKIGYYYAGKKDPTQFLSNLIKAKNSNDLDTSKYYASKAITDLRNVFDDLFGKRENKENAPVEKISKLKKHYECD